MKFCMVTTFYPPYHFGGDATFVHRLATELGRRGHSVDVVHDLDAYHLLHQGEPPFGYPPSRNVTVHPLKSRVGWLSPAATHQTGRPLFKPQLRRLLETGGHDVVHFHNASLIGPGAFGWGNGIKLYTIHEQWLVCPMHLLWKYRRRMCDARRCLLCCLHGRRPPQAWRLTGYLERQLRKIDRFIAPSQFVLDTHRAFGLELPATVLPYFLPDASPPPSAENPPHSAPYFLFVGRLAINKGLHTVLGAFGRAGSPDLLVVGDGDQAPELRAAAASMPNVRFLGALPYERLRTLYRHAMALVVPSISYEVCPIVMLEAFAEGTPVVARDLGGSAELVTTTGAGMLFRDNGELHAALDRLRGDQALRRELGAKGRRAYLERWGVEPHMRQYFNLIDGCRAARKTGRGSSA